MPGQDVDGHQNPDTHYDFNSFIHVSPLFDCGIWIADCGMKTNRFPGYFTCLSIFTGTILRLLKVHWTKKSLSDSGGFSNRILTGRRHKGGRHDNS